MDHPVRLEHDASVRLPIAKPFRIAYGLTLHAHSWCECGSALLIGVCRPQQHVVLEVPADQLQPDR